MRTEARKIARDLDKLALEMERVAQEMKLVGAASGFETLIYHGRELLGASKMAMNWADEIRIKIEEYDEASSSIYPTIIRAS